MGITDIMTETAQALRTATTWVRGPETVPQGEALSGLNMANLAIESSQESAGKFILVDGIKLHYLEQGPRNAQPVVYIHGANAYAEELFSGPLGALLARKYRVIAFDRPGFGWSERGHGMAGPNRQARLIRSALTALEIEQPILIGHSWGGALALAYGVAFGPELRGLVSMSGWCFPSNEALISVLAFSVGPYINAVKALAPPDFTRHMGERMVNQIFKPDPVPPAFARFSMELVMRKTQMAANGEDLKALNADMALLEDSYKKIKVPTEILVALQDHIVDPDRHGLKLGHMMPGACVTKLADHGHMAHHLDPQPFLAAVERLTREEMIQISGM